MIFKGSYVTIHSAWFYLTKLLSTYIKQNIYWLLMQSVTICMGIMNKFKKVFISGMNQVILDWGRI